MNFHKLHHNDLETSFSGFAPLYYFQDRIVLISRDGKIPFTRCVQQINIPFFRNNSEIFSPKYFLSENTSAYQNVQAYFNLIKANGN